MKKLMFATALVASVAAFADPAVLQAGSQEAMAAPTAINAISFEGYTTGATLVNGGGEQEEGGGDKANNYFCYIGDTDSSSVKEFGGENVAAPDITRPFYFASDTNNKYLELSTEGGILWRSIAAVSGSGANCQLGTAQEIGSGGLYLDTLVQFTPTEDGGSPDLGESDKLAIWLNVDSSGASPVTNLMVRAGSYDDGGTLVTNLNFVLTGKAVVAGEWYRLTVKAVDNVLPAGAPWKIPAFRVYIDHTEMAATNSPISVTLLDGLVEAEMISADEKTELSSGKVLPSLLAGDPDNASTLQAVGFKGSGALDDIVWTDQDPFAGSAGGDDAWIATVTQIFDGANLDAAEKAKITAWASGNNIVVDTTVQGQAEIAAAAYLLGLSSLPTAIPELTITSIEEGADAWTLTVAASVGEAAVALPAQINGVVTLTQAGTLAGLATATPATATFAIANGTATVTVAKDTDTAKFMKVGVGIAPAANSGD